MLRVPAVAQLVAGPALWLLTVVALPSIDRRMPPPGGCSGGRRTAVHALLLFTVMAVFLYLLCRAWEAAVLRPAYRRYLDTRSGTAAETAGEASSNGAGGSDLSSLPLPAAFRFNLQDRVQCGESGAVSYKSQPLSLLMLQVCGCVRGVCRAGVGHQGGARMKGRRDG